MSEIINLHNEAMEILKETSRTFYIPISLLSKGGVQEAVAAGYLCMRAIDEIEDHECLDANVKINLLLKVANVLDDYSNSAGADLENLFKPYEDTLPEVTLRLNEWLLLCPKEIAPEIYRSTSKMAKGMAKWVDKEWNIESEEDLDEYTYFVAGLVGEMLSDIWDWHDGIESDKGLAIAFGRGLQSVNILRNRNEDLDRGVDFYPNGWDTERMFMYAQMNLAKANEYLEGMKQGEILHFCKIPLALAHGTLESLMEGKEKLTRADVTNIVQKVVSE